MTYAITLSNTKTKICEQTGMSLTLTNVSDRADSRFAPSKWETALLCNDVSHWMGTNDIIQHPITEVQLVFHSSIPVNCNSLAPHWSDGTIGCHGDHHYHPHLLQISLLMVAVTPSQCPGGCCSTHWIQTKWPPFSRRHFQMHFPQWKSLNYY